MRVLCPTATREELMFMISTNNTWIPTQNMEWIWTIGEGQSINFRSITGYVECEELIGPLYTMDDARPLKEDE